MQYMASLSGGKDSTAMILRLIEENKPLDEIIFFDTGWEFPEMLRHIEKLENYIGRPITRLRPRKSFEYLLFETPVMRNKGDHKGEIYRHGYGWPSFIRKWCSGRKIAALNSYIAKAITYIGFAFDEQQRTQGKRLNNQRHKTVYPLIDWQMSEKECLQYCYDRGFNWEGLYEVSSRVSCFCCPFQRINTLRNLRHNHPELWAKMLLWDSKITPNRGFRGYKTVHDLDKRFAVEQS